MTPLICVVKDDAYGLGIENILPVLYNEGERYYAVAFFEEASEIRKMYEDVNIIILNYTEEEKFEDMESDKRLRALAQKECDCVGDDRKYRR